MKKCIIQLILLSPFLMAFQCDEEEESQLFFSSYKATISAQSNFSTGETIWIEGRISAQAFDTAVNDSVFAEQPEPDEFSVYKLMTPNALSNAKDAVGEFEIITERGEFLMALPCENALLRIWPELDEDNQFYSYRIGLKTNEPGDYVLSWRKGFIQNTNRHTFIIDNYPIENHPNQIGFNTCGSVSWRFLNDSEREYYFTVE
ncbi:hypothetical protein FJ651_10485 [Paucihalobacter ruber]|uniref:Uncharacterized protein n=1 Tax=Paucihalobacter ruber TaxID=2567861 RepID=A0A506PI57_9FLAO|nr:hypothetical protein [Paucihalobacter ruber]TPV33501.1 hypothetical protein FJ651_10485 [Paucihalobacter ruber]